GMMLGNQDGDGTIAGIISAFMALFGILAAKGMIVIIFISAAVGGMVNEMDLEGVGPAEANRELAAIFVAEHNLKAKGVDTDDISEEQWDEAYEAAKTELAGLDDAAIEKKIE